MRKKFPALFALVLLLAGCRPLAAPTPVAVTVAARPIVITPIIQVVTSTPRPTITPSPAPTLPYDPKTYEGTWRMQINYQIYNGAYWADIRYNAGLELMVNANGEMSGEGIFYPSLQQPPCPAFINNSTGLPMKITGKLGWVNGTVVGVLQIIPQEPKIVQDFVLACADSEHATTAKASVLWPALEATNQLNLTIPFAPATVNSSLRSLTTASGGRLYGTLTTEIRLNR